MVRILHRRALLTYHLARREQSVRKLLATQNEGGSACDGSGERDSRRFEVRARSRTAKHWVKRAPEV